MCISASYVINIREEKQRKNIIEFPVANRWVTPDIYILINISSGFELKIKLMGKKIMGTLGLIIRI